MTSPISGSTPASTGTPATTGDVAVPVKGSTAAVPATTGGAAPVGDGTSDADATTAADILTDEINQQQLKIDQLADEVKKLTGHHHGGGHHKGIEPDPMDTFTNTVITNPINPNTIKGA